MLLKKFGINTELFEHALTEFESTKGALLGELKTMVSQLLSLHDQIYSQMASLFLKPFRSIPFNIDNTQYEEYETKEVIFSETLNSFNQVLRQWKTYQIPDLYSCIFVP